MFIVNCKIRGIITEVGSRSVEDRILKQLRSKKRDFRESNALEISSMKMLRSLDYTRVKGGTWRQVSILQGLILKGFVTCPI